MYCNYKLSRDIFRFLKMDARNENILREVKYKFLKKIKIIKKYKKNKNYFNFEKNMKMFININFRY